MDHHQDDKPMMPQSTRVLGQLMFALSTLACTWNIFGGRASHVAELVAVLVADLVAELIFSEAQCSEVACRSSPSSSPSLLA